MARENAVLLRFRTFDSDTSNKVLAVQAYDLDEHEILANLPPVEMAKWLENRGYRWRPGSNGVWERAA